MGAASDRDRRPGLKDALATFVKEWSKQYGIEANFLSNVETTGNGLPDGVDINLYRILQECLNNIMKHAGAKEVNVLLQERPDQLVLAVEDDGIGIEGRNRGKKSQVSRGLGIVGMEERAALLGGSFEIESRRGMGTTVLVRVPRKERS
jgi:signal transduction histidine kinase